MLTRHPRRTFLLLSTLLLLALYARTLAAPFLYDDLDQILNNPALATWHTFAPRFLLHPVDLTATFLGHPGSTFRPLFWLSLFLDRTLFGTNPAAFHATNLALQLLNTNLLFALLLRSFEPRTATASTTPHPAVTGTPPPGSTPVPQPRRRKSLANQKSLAGPTKAPIRIAAATALLWLALPINTEVVAWISARAYLLATALLLTALLALLAHRARPTRTTLALSLAAAIAAPFAHELGLLTLPLALLLLTLPDSKPRTPYLAHTRLPLTLIALADAAILTLRHHLAVHPTSGLNPPLVSLESLGEYLSLTVLPLHLSVERSTTHLHPALLLATAAFVAALTAALALRRTAPSAAIGLLWFLVSIAPFCLFTNYQGLAERFTYLASIGLTVALATACLTPQRPQLRIPALTLWAAFSLYRTTTRVADWTDPVRLYTASLRANPQSPSLHYNLAFSLRERGDLDQALHEYQTTLTLDRTHPHAYASLGDLYLDLHAYIAAQAAFHQALRQTPNDPAVLLNLATAYQQADDPAAAEATFHRVLALDPANTAAHIDLGVLLQQQSRFTDAMHQFAIAIDLKSTDPVPFYNLAVLFQQAGRPDLALPLYKKVLALRPDDPDTLRNLQQLHP